MANGDGCATCPYHDYLGALQRIKELTNMIKFLPDEPNDDYNDGCILRSIKEIVAEVDL